MGQKDKIKTADMQSPPKGQLVLFLGVVPHTEKTISMLEYAKARFLEGDVVYVSGVNPQVHKGAKQIEKYLNEMSQSAQRVRSEDCLSSDEAVLSLIESAPDLLVLGGFAPLENAKMPEREARVQKIIEAGVDVYISLNVYQIFGVLAQLPKPVYAQPENLVSRSFVQQADSIQVIDTSVYQVLESLRKTALVRQYPFIADNISAFVREENVEGLRKELLAIAVENSQEQSTLTDLEMHTATETVETLKAVTRVPYFKTFMYDNAIALFVIAVCTLVNALVDYSLTFDLKVKEMVYLTGVVAVTLFTNLYTGLLGVAGAYFAYNFFFIPPIYSVSFYNFPDVAIAIIFGFCAVLINLMTHAAFKKMARYKNVRELESHLSRDFVEEVMSLKSIDKAYKLLIQTLEMRLGLASSALYIAAEGQEVLTMGLEVDEKDQNIALALLENQKQKTPIILPPYIVPIETQSNVWGVLVLRHREGNVFIRRVRDIVNMLAQITARNVERLMLGDIVQETLLENERERLRSALLSSISHDLKTPLASIIGALSTLTSFGSKVSKEDADSLVESSLTEAKRLNQFISNILEISKIESGNLNLNKQWCDPQDLLYAIQKRAQDYHGAHVMLYLDEAGDEIFVDPVLFEQVLFNLTDNAVKYAGVDNPVDIIIDKENGEMTIQVRDSGPGLDEENIDKYFDKFYRHNMKDSVQAGTGLGLAICKGMLEAQGLAIKAYNRKDEQSGAVFEIVIPGEYVRHEHDQ